MPIMSLCLLEPIWEQFVVLLPAQPVVAPSHPLGCHRPRVADRVVFEHVVAALVRGSGYERIATPGCSDRTIRRRLREWAEADVAVDGCITKAPGGGQKAGRSPVDRG